MFCRVICLQEREILKKKFFRFLEKYLNVKFENAPYHYLKLSDENEANEIRMIFKKI